MPGKRTPSNDIERPPPGVEEDPGGGRSRPCPLPLTLRASLHPALGRPSERPVKARWRDRLAIPGAARGRLRLTRSCPPHDRASRRGRQPATAAALLLQLPRALYRVVL